MTSWLSWLSTFREILDITTLPITRLKKDQGRMGHPTAISDRCWCSALSSPWSRSSLLGSTPTRSFRCTAPKKTGQESFAHFVLFINSWSAKTCQVSKTERHEKCNKTLLEICHDLYAAGRWPSPIATWYWSFENTSKGVRLKGFLRMSNQFKFLVNFQGPGLYSVSMPPFQDHPRMMVVVGVGLGGGFGGIPDAWRMGFPTEVLAEFLARPSNVWSEVVRWFPYTSAGGWVKLSSPTPSPLNSMASNTSIVDMDISCLPIPLLIIMLCQKSKSTHRFQCFHTFMYMSIYTYAMSNCFKIHQIAPNHPPP